MGGYGGRKRLLPPSEQAASAATRNNYETLTPPGDLMWGPVRRYELWGKD
jgi:hypothetical protein